ncbi:hypothetical protein V1264_012386 [Littorina saxatilis]|uniref:Cadherin domain-containing protein n=1 Tax=Littorina saxatilis TaxID=31220 RepID=A0AAN9BUT8_9CAEN
MFEVNSSTCEVTLRNALTSDTAQAYTVLIEAFDNAGAATRSSTGTLTMNVDRNLYPPQFINQLYSFEILEIQELGIPFGYANASDNDTVSPYGDIYYEAMGNDTVLTYFGINADGGLVSLRSQWQYPDRSENIFRYDVRLRDGAGQQSPVTASVNVTVIRNTQPVFNNTANYRVSNLTEDTAGGTVVFTPTVTNQDSRNPFDDLEFEMIGDGRTTAFFQANKANGAISVRPDSDLTSDTESEYIARLVVRDGGTPRLSDTSTVVIQVPRNNFSPGFLHGDLTVRIPFNEDIGTVVADVNATDNDGQDHPEGKITYSMVSGNTDNNIEYFKVYPDTGQLILTENAGLDSIPNDRFVVTLAATDQGSPTRTGEVTITVIIDKDPSQLLCGQNPFVFTTSENSNVDTVVGSVTAAPSASGSISYEVVGSPPGDSFFRMTSTGVITVSADLRTDPAKLQNYQVSNAVQLNLPKTLA